MNTWKNLSQQTNNNIYIYISIRGAHADANGLAKILSTNANTDIEFEICKCRY